MLAQPDLQTPPRVESCILGSRPAAGLTAHRTNTTVFLLRPEPT